MSAISIQKLLDYMNQARTNPKKFAQYIQKQLDSFITQSTLPLKPNCNCGTHQGKRAWKQTIDFLKNQKPLPAFQLNEGLNLSAMDHATDMKTNNFFDHQSSNGMSFSQRISRRCGESYGASGQNLGTDFEVPGRNHALQTVTGLIIDDGVPSRGHRKNIFHDKYKYCGIYSVKVGDKLYTCINYHSQNVQVIQNSKSPLTGSQKGNKKPQQFSNLQSKPNMNKGWQKQFENLKINDNKGSGLTVNKVADSNNGERYVTSKSTNIKTSTKNGRTTKVTTINLKYSDGSTEQQINQQTY